MIYMQCEYLREIDARDFGSPKYMKWKQLLDKDGSFLV